MRLAVGVVLVLALGLSLWWIGWRAPETLAEPTSHDGTATGAEATFRDTATWRHRAADGDPVRFVREPVFEEAPPVVGEIKPLGRLEGSDFVRLLRISETQVEHTDDRLQSFQKRMDKDDSDDLLREAKLLYHREIASAANVAVRRGDYIVVPNGTAHEIVAPPDCDTQSMGCHREGVGVVAVVILPHSENTLLRDASDYQSQMEDYRVSEVVRKFNELPRISRMRLVARHKELRNAKDLDRTTIHMMYLRFPNETYVDEQSMLMHMR